MPLTVVVPPGSDDLAEACGKLGCRWAAGNSAKQVPSLIDFGLQSGVSSLTVLHGLAGLDVMPPSLLREVAGIHEVARPDVTVVDGMPVPLFVAVLGRAFLEMVSALPPRIVQRDEVGPLVDVIEQAVGCDPNKGGVVVVRAPFAALCNLPAESVPACIPWTEAGDLQRIDEETSNPPSGAPACWLPRLRERIVEDLEIAHRPRRLPRQRPLRRVLYVSNPSVYSGAEEALVTTIASLRGSGLDIHCLIGQDGLFADRARAAGATVHIPHRDCSSVRVDTFLMADTLISEIAPDVIHSNGAIGLPMIAVSRLRGIPFVQWARIADLSRVFDHLVSADMITAVSSFIAREAARQMIRPGKIQVLHDCIDAERYSPDLAPRRDIRAELGIAPGEFVILNIARYVPYKRHDILIHAAALAYERHPSIRLLLVGDPHVGGEAYHETQSLIDRLGLRRRTIVLGFQQDIHSVEAAADAFVLCSEREPLGTAVLENMALGKPVVVAASGGLVEMVEDEITGLHCQPGDAESLAGEICRLVADRELAHSLGRRARRRAVERFSMREHAEKLQALYSKL
ncbi:MAG: glycosyltransferase family 4 protein [Bryobacteraceae bacterium]